ncbi:MULTISPECIES: XrtA system polysaccharide chain length determinant [unclassified Erythrobacter]|jgi:polysaccharide chain length determinant protein (PEP-CTERM system associated)|uniref:XrtA system polysaccharide chain length determinant n=1 Tax=unclassified Erythrobacter TaxID=2633097 RepID=UPI00076D16C5|nr:MULTISPECIES: XrtA system polysaccharide chain length determinant [unclassified Erythrobacter]KWV96124.1 chain-length determining protein [Erythrobacter sp. AP23]MBO6769618.1 chain-length determining protein [Erythrobacter sp.]
MQEVFDELRSALHTVWNRRWIALGVAWGVCLLGWLAVGFIPNSYESRARIYVELEDVLSEQLDISGDGKQAITKVRQTLVSAVNLERVVRSTKLGDKVATDNEMQNAVQNLTDSIVVESEQDNLFTITATIGKSSLSDSENATLSKNVVQSLIDIFRESNIAGNRGDVADTIAFLDQQLEDRKRELEAAEQRRLAFEAQHPDLIGGSGTVTGRLQGMRTEMRGIDADIAAAQSALAAINGQIASTPPSIVTAGSGGARGALLQAQSQLAAMRARGLTDSHPDIQAQQRQIATLREQAANEPAGSGGSPNPAYTSLMSIRAERQANVQALQARKAALQSDISALIAAQADEPAVAAEANRISRDYEVLKDKYDDLLKDREEMRLRGQVETERSAFQFEVIDPPTAPRAPAAPNRPILLLGVLIVGIGAGAGVAFVMGQLKSSFTTADKLERVLDLPVIGTISRSMTEAARKHEKLRLKQFLAGAGGLAGVCFLLLVVEMVQVGSVA